MNDLEAYYVFKTEKGLAERGLSDKPEYVARLQYENGVIRSMGFCGYFLVVQDIIQWCKRNGIYVGPGRGSAAGSLISYCLGITQLDPLQYNLIFERFMNPDRISMPDCDIDIEKRYRDRVIAYMMARFGEDHVAHIGTFGTRRAKAAIKDVARTLGHPFELGNQLSKLVLPPVAGKPQSLETSIQKVPELHTYMQHKGSTQEQVLSWALKLENSISNVGSHASGVIISNAPLVETAPLLLNNDGLPTAQWAMKTIEEIGLIKFDFLGLKALEIIHAAIDLIPKSYAVNIDFIPLDDEATYALLGAGQNINIFQLEGSSGIRDLLMRVQPKNITDIANIIAIYRPGPLASDYMDTYLRVRAGLQEPEYLVPELAPILSDTAGFLIFQEQVMEISKQLCGFSGGEADTLRKGIGKKEKKVLEEQESKFLSGWEAHGLDPSKGRELWAQILDFADYSFNRAHAYSYAIIAYQTAYLKAHFSSEFMCAVMASEAGNRDDIIKCITECKRMGLQVLPPDINQSDVSFSLIDSRTVRFGLGPIKFVGEASVSSIIDERRENGPYQGLLDFCSRIDLGVINKTKLEALVMSGAFDRFGKTRAALMNTIEQVLEYKHARKAYESKLATYQKRMEAYNQRLQDIEDGLLSPGGQKLKPVKLPEAPNPPELPSIPVLEELPKSEIQKQEHELLGFYVSSHPLDDIVGSKLEQIFTTIEDTKGLPARSRVVMGIVITNINEITTRTKKEKMAFLSIEDLTGGIEAVCFPSTYAKTMHLLQKDKPLQIIGTVEITESDDDRITKIIVNDVKELTLEPHLSIRTEYTIPVRKVNEFRRVLERYSGSSHEINITLEADDGTKFGLPPVRINKMRGAFIRELLSIEE